MKKIFPLSGVTLLFLTSCLLITQWTESTPEPIPPTPEPESVPSNSDPESIPPADRSIYKDGLASEYQDVLNKLPYASMYEIKFNIADDLNHVTGNETVIYTNAEDIDLKEVKFRLFANILGGEMHVDEATVNGEVVIPNYSLDDSLLTVPLKSPLKPKESVTLSMDFSLAVPQTVETVEKVGESSTKP